MHTGPPAMTTVRRRKKGIRGSESPKCGHLGEEHPPIVEAVQGQAGWLVVNS